MSDISIHFYQIEEKYDELKNELEEYQKPHIILPKNIDDEMKLEFLASILDNFTLDELQEKLKK